MLNILQILFVAIHELGVYFTRVLYNPDKKLTWGGEGYWISLSNLCILKMVQAAKMKDKILQAWQECEHRRLEDESALA